MGDPGRGADSATDTTLRALAPRQVVVILLLFAGYAAYYFCRSDFSVAMPMLIDEFHQRGMSVDTATIHLGSIASFGVLAYACGKLFLGGLGDLWGGRRSFLGGTAGAVVFTCLFTLSGGLPMFTLAWIGNRLRQSIGWAGLVKICSRWFDYTSYGRMIGILSLSFLIGDAAATQSMALLIRNGHSWRFLFLFAAVICGCILVANLFFLRESRTELGFPEPAVNPSNVFQNGISRSRHKGLGSMGAAPDESRLLAGLFPFTGHYDHSRDVQYVDPDLPAYTLRLQSRLSGRNELHISGGWRRIGGDRRRGW